MNTWQMNAIQASAESLITLMEGFWLFVAVTTIVVPIHPHPWLYIPLASIVVASGFWCRLTFVNLEDALIHHDRQTNVPGKRYKPVPPHRCILLPFTFLRDLNRVCNHAELLKSRSALYDNNNNHGASEL